MKKIFLLLIGILILIPTTVFAEEKVDLYLFYGDGCPHCAEEKEDLIELQEEYPQLEVHLYEVWYNAENREFLSKVSQKLDIKVNGVPFTVIGDIAFTGYTSARKKEFEQTIEYYLNNPCPDIKEEIEKPTIKLIGENKVQILLNEEYVDAGATASDIQDGLLTNNIIVDSSVDTSVLGEYTVTYNVEDSEGNSAAQVTRSVSVVNEIIENDNETISLGIFGDINTKDVSLPIITILIGLVDGFNPCAMWILLFLISMLLGMKDKKRMWTLGLTFIVTSAVVYFAFMAAWLNLIMLIGTIIIIRTLIGVFGIGAGLFNIRNYLKERKEDGCQVVDKKKRKDIFNKIKKFTHEKSFALAIIGIMALAISVNLIEMLCSLGLPAIYVELLNLNNLSVVGKYFYLILYTFVFMLDDIIIFTIAMVTLKTTGISTKYSKYSHLIGGILMLAIGILLIVKPEILMFG